MNCHRCIHLRYDGCPYGHCVHPAHPDVVFTPLKDRKGPGMRTRPYSKEKCPDFATYRRCSNCNKWLRGRYFRDGRTPAAKGKCSIGLVCKAGDRCPMWEQGWDSSKKRSNAT